MPSLEEPNRGQWAYGWRDRSPALAEWRLVREVPVNENVPRAHDGELSQATNGSMERESLGRPKA